MLHSAAMVLCCTVLAMGQGGGGMAGGGGTAGGGMAGGQGGIAIGGGGMGQWGVHPPSLSDNFVALWDAVGVSATLSQAPEGPMEQPVHSLCITGAIEVLDSEKVMGLSTNNIRIARVLDENNRGVQYGTSFNARTMRSYQTLTGPAPFALELDLDPKDTWPLVVSSLEFEVYAMYARDHEVFEIPFMPSEDWVELKPGISVCVDQAQCDGADYSYLLRIQYEGVDPTRFDANRHMVHLPDDMVMSIQLLDPEGELVPESKADSMRIDQLNIRAGKGTAAEVQAIQFKLATEPREEKISLWLTDLPVPSL